MTTSTDAARHAGHETSEHEPGTRARRNWLVELAVGLALVVLVLVLLASRSRGGGAPPASEAVAARTPSSQPAPVAPYVTRDEQGHLQWPRPRTTDWQRERDQLVDRHIARGDQFSDAVKEPRVIAAMRAVPRHEFVPRSSRGRAYIDSPLPIGHGQTISQPYIVALMTELLDVDEGERVLEIGTGSGYQAAVLNELTPYVYSIEILEPLHDEVVARFERLGYKTIQTRHADGYDGWAEAGPFDGIIVTCAAGHVPPPLWEQLKPGGRMVIPVGGVYETQRLLVLEKDAKGQRSSRSVLAVRFVPMTGKAQEK
ncbi:MAG: protein-L-isoaspartate(D-aspartate) O-methyltransferase [Phycisphaerae bacterium]|nr:protein-L-isoaspartate(D-aspartate) O-methyltransferase [Phycisphaerae bacterium]